MRIVLAITALMAAVLILTPALGYTIQASGSPYPFTIQSGNRVNYTVVSGEPAHSMALEQAIASAPRYSFSSQRVPFSFNTAGAPGYTAQAGAVTNGVSSVGTIASENTLTLGQGSEAREPGRLGAVPAAAPLEAPVEAPTAPVEAPVEAPIEAAAPAANITEAAPAEVVDAVPVPATYSISGTVYNDANANGAVDEGETGMAGWMINLAQPADTIIANTTSDANGVYTFVALIPGEYTVSEAVMDGWTAISPATASYTMSIVDMDVTGLDFANSNSTTPA